MQFYSPKDKKELIDKNNLSCFIQFDKNMKRRQQNKLQNISQLLTQYRTNYRRQFPNQNNQKFNDKMQINDNDSSYYTTDQEFSSKYKHKQNKKNCQKDYQQSNQPTLNKVLSSQVLNYHNKYTLSKNSSQSSLFNCGINPKNTSGKKEKLIEKLEIHKNSLNSIQQKLNKFGIQLGQKKQAKISPEIKLKKDQTTPISHSQSLNNFQHFSRQSRPLTSLRQKQYTIEQIRCTSPSKQQLMTSINSGGSHHSKKFKMNIQNLIGGQRVNSNNLQEAFKKPRSFGNQKKSPIYRQKQIGTNETQLKNFSPKSACSMNSGQNWFKRIDRTLKQTVSTDYSSKDTQLSIDEFAVGKLIGKGKFGQVHLCIHKKTGFLSAIKVIKKQIIRKQRSLQQLTRQVKIQSFLNHCNNVKMYAFFDDKTNIYLLLEYCVQGHLYSILKQRKRFPQQEAVFILKDICEGIKELHQKNIIHRDIKPQNVVMCYKMAKLCDYGWSVNCQNQKRQTFCGTPLYVSPELLTGKTYDYKVDIWALGIMAYQLLTGRLPFQIATQKQLQKIVTNQIKYPNYLSPKAVNFMKHLLQKDPSYRNDIHSILKHDFFTQGLTKRQCAEMKKV